MPDTPAHDGPRGSASRVPEVAGLLVAQKGVLSRAQLREHGVSHGRVQHEIAVGRWTVVAPGVVAAQNVPLSRQQTRWLGVLHAGAHAALTHASACESGGLSWTVDPTVHVLTPKGDLVEPLPGLRFHQTRRPYRGWVTAGGDEPPRIDLEHAVLLTSERDRCLRRAVGRLAAAVQQGLTTADRLLDAAMTIRKLRHGDLFRLALGDIGGGAQSFAEIRVGVLCRAAGLQPPRRQVVRADRDGRRRYLDCSWELPDGRLVVLEVDGGFHRYVDSWWKDLKRERSVVGWNRVVLRCASVELRLEPDGILADLRALGVPRVHPGFVCDLPA